MELLEVFKDLDVLVESGSHYKRYRCLKRVVPLENPKKIGVEDLKEYAKRLNERYPDRHFYVRAKKFGDRSLYVLSQAKRVREEISQVEERKEALEAEVEALTPKLQEASRNYENVKKLYESEAARLKSLEKRNFLVRLLLFFRIRGCRRRVEELRGRLQSLESKLKPLKAKFDELTAKLQEIEKQLEKGGIKKVEGRLSILFDLSAQPPKIYVYRREYQSNPKLANYILMRTLGALGLTQTKYVRHLGRA